MNDSPLMQSLASAVVDRAHRVVAPPSGRKGVYWTEQLSQEFLDQPVETLIEHPYFMGLKWDEERKLGFYPCHMEDVIKIWHLSNEQKINWVVDVEGFGSGKSTKYAVLLWLQVFRLLCRISPQEYYGLDRRQDLALLCMNRNNRLAKMVTFRKVLPYFNCPFFRDYFPPVNVPLGTMLDEKNFPSQLRFPKNVVVFPGSAAQATALGYDIIGGCIDEANHCEVISDSKKSIRSGIYDAAEETYLNLTDRITSRLNPTSPQDWLFCMLSSTGYPGDFCERRIEEVKRKGVFGSRMYAIRRTTWGAKPWGYSGNWIYFDTTSLKLVSKEEYEAQSAA